MQTNHRINLLPFKRALSLGLLLGGLWFCRAVAGAEEILRIYDYKGFDTNGVLQVSGVITLRLDDTVKIKGDWKLQVLNRDKLKEAGPQDGSGKISGQFKEDTIFLNLNPDQVQDNIYLDGKVTDAKYSEIKGKWGYYAFVGKVTGGNFEMVRKQAPAK